MNAKCPCAYILSHKRGRQAIPTPTVDTTNLIRVLSQLSDQSMIVRSTYVLRTSRLLVK
jgi:hypothetical protein